MDKYEAIKKQYAEYEQILADGEQGRALLLRADGPVHQQ
jgi:hypothetical protein